MILVGFSPSRDDRCSLDLACQLARSNGDSVVAVTVVPRGWPTPVARNVDEEFDRWAAQQGAAAAAESRRLLAEHSDVVSESIWLTGRSVPQSLLEEASRRGADTIVLGSGTSGPHGAISLTSKTERVLHSSEFPVALAPRAYEAGPKSRFSRATVAYRGDEQTDLLELAAKVSLRAGVELRMLTFAVRARTMYPPLLTNAEDEVLDSWIREASAAQQRAIAKIHLQSPGLSVTPVVAAAGTWSAAFDRLPWHHSDLLVVGSSAAQPVARVFLGSSASKIVRNSPVPVLVVP